MVDVLDSMIEAVADALRQGDREAAARARRQDDLLDALNSEIKRYLTRLDPESLTEDEHRRAEAVLAFSFNLEGAGDVVELNLASFVAKRLKRGVEASLEDDREIQEAFEAVRANLRSAASVFTTGDKRAARVLSQQKAEFPAARAKQSRPISPGFASSAGPRRRHLIFCAISSALTTIWWPGRPIPSLKRRGN
jgi:phosphate:Na+ symporter